MQCQFCQKIQPIGKYFCNLQCKLNKQFQLQERNEEPFSFLNKHKMLNDSNDKILPSISFNNTYSMRNLTETSSDGSLNSIGKGAFSTVYLFHHSLFNQLVAVKHINKKQVLSKTGSLDNIYKEISFHSRIVHKNIIRLYCAEENETNFNLIMDYAKQGNLYSLIKQTNNGFDEKEALNYFYQVLSAVDFLHQNNILHRDIKPENILIDESNNIKLADFGNCTGLEIGLRSTICGTVEYMAPEIIKNESYDKSIDIWSLGILLYELLHRFSPFNTVENQFDRNMICDNILHQKIQFKSQLSVECKDLIAKMLEINQSNRIKMADIFNHPFLKSHIFKLEKDNIEKVNLFGNRYRSESNKHIAKANKHKKDDNDLFLENVLSQMNDNQRKKKRNISQYDFTNFLQSQKEILDPSLNNNNNDEELCQSFNKSLDPENVSTINKQHNNNIHILVKKKSGLTKLRIAPKVCNIKVTEQTLTSKFSQPNMLLKSYIKPEDKVQVDHKLIPLPLEIDYNTTIEKVRESLVDKEILITETKRSIPKIQGSNESKNVFKMFNLFDWNKFFKNFHCE